MRAELTASERVGVHRYTFPADAKRASAAGSAQQIYNYPGKVLWSRVRVREGRHGDRDARDARLGAGAAALFCDAVFARL